MDSADMRKLRTNRPTNAKYFDPGSGALGIPCLRGSPETLYSEQAEDAHKKKFGQYFTPPTVASLMADWVLECQPSRVLDPALGTGALVRAVLQQNAKQRIAAYEIDARVLSHCDVRESSQVEIMHDDFLKANLVERFGGIIMNPPYIRHREIEGYENARSALSLRSGFVIPKSANLYIYFAVKALTLLEKHGRASFLIPTEWMNANFASGFKRFLLENKLLKELVIFSGCSNIFDGALTTASVLFLERDND